MTEYSETANQEFTNHPVNININVIINSITISLYNEITSILDKNISANAHLNAKITTIDAIVKFKFLSNIVVIKVIITLKTSDIKLIFSINFSSLKVFKYVLISNAIFPSNTHIGNSNAIYIKLSAYCGNHADIATLSG
ncbi:hypothetical protein SDC9_167201 [bioreactor metagenome]|uniref:Uncharacterized protein n=1 Tax=bioreactor metagenome TaxID=1076179 RepID=A0A645G1Z6_9ZZZZ